MQHSPRPLRATSGVYATIEQAMRVGDIAQAMHLAQAALDAGHLHPVLFNLRAQACKTAGRMDAALADLRRARELDPKSAVILGEIAQCQNWLGRTDEALASADAALARDRTLAAAWYQKGIAHAARIEYAAAGKALRESVRRDPKLADAHAQLASLEAGQGDFAAARNHADAALTLDPANPVALVARVSTDLAGGRLAEAEKILQAMLADRALAPPMRAAAAAQLGDLRDLQGQPDKAFGAYRESRRAGELGCAQVERMTAFIERSVPQAAHDR